MSILGRVVKAIKRVYRSAVTGRYISKAEAEGSPETTISERRP